MTSAPLLRAVQKELHGEALDENDRLVLGILPADPAEGTEPFQSSPPPGRFDDEGPTSQVGTDEKSVEWTKLDQMIPEALRRSEARADGREKSIPLPWKTVGEQFGGGIWPGFHVLVSSTGIGKTALALILSLYAARAGIEVGYVALELESFQLALRVLCDEAGVPWSLLYTGKAGPGLRRKAADASPKLTGLPLRFITSTSRRWTVSQIERVAKDLRGRHPETDGSRPLLLVIDYLQLIGADDVRMNDRERVAAAAGELRAVAITYNLAVLAISSVGRDKQGVLARAFGDAGLIYQTDDEGRPTKRRMLNPDAIVGLGRESGDIEYSADSVNVLFRVSGTWEEGYGSDVIFATPKGRATGATWCVLRFSGFGYSEPPDGGAGAMRAIEEAKKRKRKPAVEEPASKSLEDAIAVAKHLRAKEQAGEVVSVRAARLMLADSSARWKAAKEELGSALVQRKPAKNGLAASLVVVADKLSDEIREALGFAPRESAPEQLDLGGAS